MGRELKADTLNTTSRIFIDFIMETGPTRETSPGSR